MSSSQLNVPWIWLESCPGIMFFLDLVGYFRLSACVILIGFDLEKLLIASRAAGRELALIGLIKGLIGLYFF